MKELVVHNLKYEIIEQLKKDDKLFNRVFISFELENTTKNSFNDVRVKVLYKTGGKDNSYDITINHVAPNETFTYGYEQYFAKEILELSSEIEYKENNTPLKKEFEVYKFNKDNELLFKIANKTGKDVNYARVYIEFIKGKKAFTGTNILLSAIKDNEEREVQFFLPKTFKCDSYVLKVDYSDEQIMSVYKFGKKYVEVMEEYMEATNIENKILDMGSKVNELTKKIEYYTNYKPVPFGKALWEATKDTLGDFGYFFVELIGLLFGSIIRFLLSIAFFIPLAIGIVFGLFEALDISTTGSILILVAIFLIIMIVKILSYSSKTMKSNLTQDEIKNRTDALYNKVDLLQNDLNDTDKRLANAVKALEDLEFRYPQYELPPLNTVSRLFLSSLTSAIEETDISWEEVMRVTKEKYYEAYEEAQHEITRIEEEMKEAAKLEEERNREMQRRFEEQKFREQLLREQRNANYAIQSELEKQTKEINRAANDSWQKAQSQTDVLNAIYRDRYYNN
ncbi:MAG: hypothetical protein PHI22_02985 [Bacilli bacterium]|nr:hypothetical protein [Bacilli bacterium]